MYTKHQKSKSEQLNNMTWFRTDRTTKKEEVIDKAEKLLNELNICGNKRLNKKCLVKILTELLACWECNPEKYIAYSRDNNSYTSNRDISYVALVRITKALSAVGYIEVVPGYYQSERYALGKCSRMRATEKLVNEVFCPTEFCLNDIELDNGFSPIQLRETSGQSSALVEYAMTHQTKKMIGVVNAYNALLAKTDISIPTEILDSVECARPDFSRNHVYRVFNHGSFSNGGRFYGPWWLNSKRELRQHIRINGEPTTELDYSAQHPSLMYERENAICPEDVYSIDRSKLPDHFRPDRDTLKHMFLVALYTKSIKEFCCAVCEYVYREMNYIDRAKEFPQGVTHADIRLILDLLVETNEPIKSYLCSARALEMQRIDSQIAEYVIDECTRQNVPVLCIHDSFVVSDWHLNFLICNMRNAYKNLGIESDPPIETKTDKTDDTEEDNFWDDYQLALLIGISMNAFDKQPSPY